MGGRFTDRPAFAGARQEVRTCPSEPVLAVACRSLIAVPGATLAASVAAAGDAGSGFLRLRTSAAAAPAVAAASSEMPATLRQREGCGLAGSSRRAADDNRSEEHTSELQSL